MTQTERHCSSPEQIHLFLHGQLTTHEEAELQSHLDDCLACRALLSNAAADESSWNEARQFLGGDALRKARLAPLGASEEPVDERESIVSLLKLLGPTDDPHMLGRIGSYEIVSVLGRGGMGIVFKAYEPPLNRYVAIKLLLPHLAASGAARMRFAREGRAAAAVIDDNVLPIFSVAEWQDIPYLVTQLSRGTNLEKRIRENGPLELKEILRIGMQTASGLAAAHAQGLVHRDVKPSNILLDGTVERALLTDFGLARAVDDASITCSGIIAGTPQYMSPEQARGGSVDARSDLFGLGSVLYTMCTGRPPFRADNSLAVLRLITDSPARSIREINPDIPEWLCTITDKLMSKQANDRYPSAAKVAELLSACLAHVQQPTSVTLPVELRVETKPRSVTNRTQWISYRRALPILGVLIAALSMAFVWLTRERRRDDELSAANNPFAAMNAADPSAEGSRALVTPSKSPDDAIIDLELLMRADSESSPPTQKHVRGVCVSHAGLVVVPLRKADLEKCLSISVIKPFQGTAHVVASDEDHALTLLGMNVPQRKTFFWLKCRTAAPKVGQYVTVVGPESQIPAVVTDVNETINMTKDADGFLVARRHAPPNGTPIRDSLGNLPVGSAILADADELQGLVADNPRVTTVSAAGDRPKIGLWPKQPNPGEVKGKVGKALEAKPPVRVTCVITELNKPGTNEVEVSVGLDDGIKPGDQLQVTQGGQVVGKVEITKAQAARSLARIIEVAPGKALDRSDQAETPKTNKR